MQITQQKNQHLHFYRDQTLIAAFAESTLTKNHADLPPDWWVVIADVIGFRAPKTHELMHEFLSYMQDNLIFNNGSNPLYSDPNLQLQQHPAEISGAMVSQVSAMLQKITWNNDQVADFLAKYLTEPKSDIYFKPAKKLRLPKFIVRLQLETLVLDLKSQMLFTNNAFYLNGEKLVVSQHLTACMQALANQRYLNISTQTIDFQHQLADVLYASYLAGYIGFEA